MKRNTAYLLFVAILLTMVSCASGHEKMISRIDKMESTLKSSQTIDTVMMQELLGAYQTFVARFPVDSLSPEYLYKAAGVAVGMQRSEQAVDIYTQLIEKYSSYKKVPESYFMKAFVYETMIGNLGRASEFYNLFISKYPDHELADDAAASLKNLGKSPEQLVKEFESKADSAQAGK